MLQSAKIKAKMVQLIYNIKKKVEMSIPQKRGQ
jgi:hypothetical protein